MGNDTKRGAEPSDPSNPAPPDSPLSLAWDQAFARDWITRLARTENGKVLATLANVYTILRYDPKWAGVIAFNEHSACVVKTRPPEAFDGGATEGEWTDEDDGRLQLYLSQVYRIEPRVNIVLTAVRNVADHNKFHPIRDYLKGLTWDKTPRLDDWLRTFAGAEPRFYSTGTDGVSFLTEDPKQLEKMKPEGKVVEFTGLVARKFLVGAVARVMRPGCKMDNVLILEGVQGLGKSSSMAVMFEPWFTDQTIKIGEKDTYEIMRGQWVIELAELDALSKAEVAAAKAFFSRSNDRFRSFYGRRAATVERQTVFVGTVNHNQYLRDSSGNRRYWPVRCKWVELSDLKAERDQLWAEAFAAYEAGTPWWVQREEQPMFHAEQERRYVGDAWEGRIVRWLDGDPENNEGPRDSATMAELLGRALALGDPSKWTQHEQIRVGIIMERLGWEVVRPRGEGGHRPRIYKRPSAERARSGVGPEAKH